jgi:hypothetical protein
MPKRDSSEIAGYLEKMSTIHIALIFCLSVSPVMTGDR